MFPSLYKLVVKEYPPLLMHKLAAAVCNKCFAWGSPSCRLRSSKLREGIRELLRDILGVCHIAARPVRGDSLSENKQRVHIGGTMACNDDIWIHSQKKGKGAIFWHSQMS